MYPVYKGRKNTSDILEIAILSPCKKLPASLSGSETMLDCVATI
jgi:hypothetical protein